MPKLTGDRVYLRHPEPRDYEAWSTVRRASRAFLQPWEPTWSEEEFDRRAFRVRLRRYAEEVRDERAFAFFVFRTQDDGLIGGATLSRVHRGVAQSATLGYWIGKDFAGQGLMGAAVRALIGFCFEDLGLHRMEAACQPDNMPSRRLLERVGFQEEGMARSYLKIDGAWRDHVLYGLISTDPRG
jgi:ribosomal-protein-alanine N-acetyltransferase